MMVLIFLGVKQRDAIKNLWENQAELSNLIYCSRS